MPMKQRSSGELLDKLRSGAWGAREFRAFQQYFGDDALFAVLIAPFTAPSQCDELLVQERAGQLLRELAPSCPSDLVELIRGSLSGWNASVEQLPHYLIDCFGESSFKQAVTLVAEQVAAEPNLVRQAERLRYWAAGWRARR